MPSSSDLLLGKIAIKLNYLTEDQLRKAIQAQQDRKPTPPLGVVLVQENLLTKEQLKTVLDLQKKKMAALDPRLKRKREGVLFGKVVVNKGYSTLDQVNECLRLQALPEYEAKTLGEVMVSKAYLTPDQVREVLAGQEKILMQCPACRLTFNVLSTTGGKNAKCPRCRGPLEEPPKKAKMLAPDAEFGTMIASAIDIHGSRRPVDELASTSRMMHTACVICGEKFTGVPDETGRIRCPKCLSSFTPKRKVR